MFKKLALVAMTLTVLASTAFAGVYDELSAADQARVQNGEQVFKTVDAGEAWPKAYIYQRIEATPEEAMAVFTDINLQKSYIPNLKKSQVNHWVSKNVVVADYTLGVPWPLSDENYTVQDTLSSYDNGESYRVDWTLLRADSTKSTVGNARFEKLGGATVMCYYNYVVPGSSLAGLVKNKAMQQVKDTASSLVNQIQSERQDNQGLLQQQIQALRSELQ